MNSYGDDPPDIGTTYSFPVLGEYAEVGQASTSLQQKFVPDAMQFWGSYPSVPPAIEDMADVSPAFSNPLETYEGFQPSCTTQDNYFLNGSSLVSQDPSAVAYWAPRIADTTSSGNVGSPDSLTSPSTECLNEPGYQPRIEVLPSQREQQETQKEGKETGYTQLKTLRIQPTKQTRSRKKVKCSVSKAKPRESKKGESLSKEKPGAAHSLPQPTMPTLTSINGCPTSSPTSSSQERAAPLTRACKSSANNRKKAKGKSSEPAFDAKLQSLKLSPEPDPDPESEPRHVLIRRKRNRMAASKHRAKRNAAANALAESELQESVTQRTLMAEAAKLRGEVLRLRGMILDHTNCDCVDIQKYIRNAAQLIGESGGSNPIWGSTATAGR